MLKSVLGRVTLSLRMHVANGAMHSRGKEHEVVPLAGVQETCNVLSLGSYSLGLEPVW